MLFSLELTASRVPATAGQPLCGRKRILRLIVAVHSACSHHFVPIDGELWIGALRNESSMPIGLAKFSRVAYRAIPLVAGGDLQRARQD